MNQLLSLAWKEWCEAQAFLWIGLSVFIGLPLVGGLEAPLFHAGHFYLLTLPWVSMLGGMLAIFVGVGIVCRDFGGRLQDFWRSRPVGVLAPMTIKFLVGLAVVLICCGLPILMQWLQQPDNYVLFFLTWFPLVCGVLFSLGFLAGCIIRRNSHAVTLALSAALLLYCLPLIIPSLQWMDVSLWNPQKYWRFGFSLPSGGMYVIVYGELLLKVFGFTATFLLASLVSVRLDWHIESGRKLMYGVIGGGLLILLCSASYQLGTNLPVLQQIDLPPGETIDNFNCDDLGGYVVSSKPKFAVFGQLKNYIGQEHITRALQITPSGLRLRSLTSMEQEFGLAQGLAEFEAETGRLWLGGINLTRSEANPRVVYFSDMEPEAQESYFALWNSELLPSGEIRSRTQLIDDGPFTGSYLGPPGIIAWKNRLYLFGSHMLTLDITNATSPTVISSAANPIADIFVPFGTSHNFTLPLPAIEDLPPKERIDAILSRSRSNEYGFDGNNLCSLINGRLVTYRLKKLTDRSAEFEPVTDFPTTVLQRVFGGSEQGYVSVKNGLIYYAEGFQYGIRGVHGETINPDISVFDISPSRHLRLLGHFSAPGAEWVYPLSDGRAVVMGSKIWLVGAPQRQGE